MARRRRRLANEAEEPVESTLSEEVRMQTQGYGLSPDEAAAPLKDAAKRGAPQPSSWDTDE
ncbi:MAG TPA: hypothetical protein VM889_15015 [Candidatus Thermoplasmatota archaeon]|jgi:hypothetical protein|nr:hypothetical protein [Candidatus Thermoplasmatota archaeon]